MKKIKAVYTVELALLMPIVLLTLFLPLEQSIKLYTKVKSVSECKWEKNIDAVKQLRMYKNMGELLGGE